MDIFRELGEAVNRDWKRRNYDSAHLPEIATEALATSRLAERVSVEEICSWVLTTEQFPGQPNLTNSFGQPPLTVYSDGRLYIEVLFWLDLTTSIHQHSFSGAFYVLAGSSIHAVFGFESRERVSERMLVGDVTLRKLEHLKAGDLHAIHSGSDYVHSLFHLGYPSVTVVVRNTSEADKQPQYAYLRPHVALDDGLLPPQLIRQMQLFTMLLTTANPSAQRLLTDWLRGADLVSSFQALLKLHKAGLLHGGALVEAIEAVEARHGEASVFLRPVLLEAARMNRVFAMRAQVTDEAHRFFLALRVVAPDRATAIALVKERYPDQNPSSLLFSWIQAMNASDATRLSADEVQWLFGGTAVAAGAGA